ncbi:2-oxoglutarate (2OG) and Fe(II)-dependent oxygenase superfamily protein [Striga asiatica]|uniref:2-oxoglutarate (2OG) and Fe(II)-dependent oxygenase superfamily protein n=1 Tax=Striga asiatica TaxID=4170 RepID=A0A5A7P2E2_STRAF|nr:2-oxoglutarate (2OG) and Fe(II)-dependent oxygenase superfamily protein [Striga asiatica]
MIESLQNLWQEVRDLTVGPPPRVDRLPSPPSPLQFLRHYVAPNKPCLISAAVPDWPALSLWPSPSYLRETLASTAVSLHLTPTGKADALAHIPRNSSPCFAAAHVEKLPFPEALDLVTASDLGETKRVAYLQQQNDCFRAEYGPLAADCEDHVPWASEALGCLPEAVNFWVGNRFSETSFHKDHYENLYVVISGEKRFLLLPPTDVHRMYVREYPAAQYIYHRLCDSGQSRGVLVHCYRVRTLELKTLLKVEIRKCNLLKDSEEFELELEDPVRKVPWCSVDPYPSPNDKPSAIEKFPLYFNGPKPYEVTVKAGEMLYLPSMWFHHVRQSPDDSTLTIAINYWYDMQFDTKYAYFNFLQSIPRSLFENREMCETASSSEKCLFDDED